MVVGTGVAAAAPVSGMAGAAAAQAQRSKYIFAVALAHSRTDVSAEMISELFQVRPSTANRFIRKMVKNGVVDTPNGQGIARLAEPLQRIVPQVVEHNPAGGYLVKGRLDEITAKAKDAAKRLLDEATEAEPDPEIDEDIVTKENAVDAPDQQNVQFAISLSGDDPEQPTALTAAHSAE